MKNAFFLCSALAVLLLSGCSTAPTTQIVSVPVPVACEAAKGAPELPPETLELAGLPAGAVVQSYAANRAAWIGTAKQLRTRLESCKQ